MNDENQIIGDQEHGGIEELLKKAGKDKVVNEVVEGAKKPKVSSLGPIIAARPIEKTRNFRKVKLRAVAYHPDSIHIVTGDDSGDLRLFEFDEDKGLMLQYSKSIIPAKLAGPQTVYGLSFSPDGKYLATASADRMLRIFKTHPEFLSNDVVPFINQEHEDIVYGVDFSPDGKHIVTTCDDGYLRVFEFEGNDLKEVSKNEYSAWGVAFAPNGIHLVIGSGEDVRFLEFDNKISGSSSIIPFGIGKPIYGVDFSPDGKYVAVGSDDGADINRILDSYNLALHIEHPKPVCGVAFSPDGKNLATVCNDCYLRIFELKRK